MANYNVDIEVAVKGQARIKSLQRELTALQKAVNELRKPIDATPGATKRKQELQLAKDLLSVEKAIKRERSARTAELARQARLIALQRKEEDRLAAQRQRGLTQYNPFPNVAAGVSMGIGPEPDIKKLQRRAEIFDRIAKNRAQNLEREKAFKNLALQSGRAIAQNVGEQKAELRVIEQKSDAQRKLNRLFQDANKIRASYSEERMMRRQRRNQRIGGALSSGLIGGGFPLLFGQGGAASIGGALGGLAGGAIGGGFGFALSIIGTAAGQAIADIEDFEQQLSVLNATLTISGDTSLTTAADVKALAKELGIAKEEAIELIGQFGQFRDAGLREELARVFGPVGGAKTFEALVNARLGEEEALQSIQSLEKLIGVEAADRLRASLETNGALSTAVALQQAVLELSQETTEENEKNVKFMDRINSLFANLGMMAGMRAGVTLEGPVTAEEFGEERAENVQAPRIDLISRALELQERYLRGVAELNEKYRTGTKEVDKQEKIIERAIEAIDRQAERTDRAIGRANERLDDIIHKNQDKLAFEREYARLIEQGSTPAAAKQAVELQKQLKQLDRTYDRLIDRLDVEVASLKASIAKARAEGATEEAIKGQVAALEEIERKIAGLEEKKEGAEGAINEALAPKSDREVLEEYLTKLQGQLNDLMNPARQLIGLAETVGGAFSESFKGLVTGSMTAQQALANLFQRTADHFIDMAAQMIAAQIKMKILGIGMNFFGGLGGLGGGASSVASSAYGNMAIAGPSFFSGGMIPGFANGGRPPVGRPSIVGERGPELFVPDRAGTIVPNHAMGSANVTVNVDASGSSVEGDADQAQQLGKAIGIAVQQELVKQKRPGGLLAS